MRISDDFLSEFTLEKGGIVMEDVLSPGDTYSEII
jgi:hypothetical protein